MIDPVVLTTFFSMSGIGALLSIMISYYRNFRQNKKDLDRAKVSKFIEETIDSDRERHKIAGKAIKNVTIIQSPLIQEQFNSIYSLTKQALISDTLKTQEDPPNIDDLRSEITQTSKDLVSRLEKIEERIPDGETTENVDTIHDKVVTERIIQLTKRLDSIESRILTKWDVVTAICLVVAGTCFVVVSTYGVLVAVGIIPKQG